MAHKGFDQIKTEVASKSNYTYEAIRSCKEELDYTGALQVPNIEYIHTLCIPPS